MSRLGLFFFRLIPTALAVAFGGVTLLAFLLPSGVPGVLSAELLSTLRALFVSWAAILAAFALLAGFLNVIGVHVQRITRQQHNWPYSVALLLGVLVVVGGAGADGLNSGRLDPGGTVTSWIFANVIVQLEIAVAALLAFILAFAAYRVLRPPAGLRETRAERPVWGTLLFILAALVVLVHTVSFVVAGGDQTLIGAQAAISRLVDAASLGGTRGLLIGVALGTIATGLRVLAGIDRPHSE